MNRKDFEQLMNKALATVPARFHGHLEKVAICVDDVCVEDPELLGVYEGVPLTDRRLDDMLLPDTITLFQKTIEDEAADTDGDVYRVVRETLIHEIAHYFGFEEDEIEEKFEIRWKKC